MSILYHSETGRTRDQAEHIAAGARQHTGIAVQLVDIVRDAALEAVDSSVVVAVGCPTYLGSVSATMKQFLENSFGRMQAHAWEDKVAGVFTTSRYPSGDKLATLQNIATILMRHGMIIAGPTESRLDSGVGHMTSSAVLQQERYADVQSAMDFGFRLANLGTKFSQND